MKLVVIGSGNVASWLINALADSKMPITGIYSRNKKTSRLLANTHYLELFAKLDEIEADVIFICVNDDAINEVAKKLHQQKAILVHFSGAATLSTLNRKERSGVLWPIQTITGKNSVNEEIPLCITASDIKSQSVLVKIGKATGNKTYVIDEQQRKQLHLAAVMTNNFINHLVGETKAYLEKQNLSYELLLPILKKTLTKFIQKPYDFTQTGPAVRGDKKTISSHQNMLKESNPGLLSIYNIITTSIIKKYNS